VPGLTIKPPAGAEAPKPKPPAAATTPAAPTDTQIQKAKRQTSRVSLEKVLASAELGDSALPGSPKTIKLKRPTEAPTIKVAPRPAPAAGGGAAPTAAPVAAAAPAAGVAGVLSKTVNLDTSTSAQEGDTETQKKTIRVKRPSKAPSVKVQSRESNQPKEEAPPVPLVQFPTADNPSAFFVVCAVLAILVTGAIIWMFCAEYLGMDGHIPTVNYIAIGKGPNMPWPGKLQ